MAQGRLRKAVEKSIRYGVDTGNIDLERNAAMLGMIRYMADALDNDDGETPVLRYVTPASFLSYCEKLGFTQIKVQQTEKEKQEEHTKITVVGGSRWKSA